MPLWDFFLNRFCTSVTPVGASTTYYASHHRLSRDWDKTDISYRTFLYFGLGEL
jgi:hypothetical protein